MSFLMPVADAAPWIDAAIESLRRQTVSDFEIVCVDDGSTDGTRARLASWAGREPRLRVVHQRRAGIVAALERARHAARAPLLARMDADDVALPHRLERQLALLDGDPRLVAVGAGVEYFPADRVAAGARRYERWINGLVSFAQIERDLFVECPIAHPTLLVRSAALAAVGGYVDRGWPEDYDLVLRLWAAGGRLANVPDVLLRWRERPGRLSRTHRRYAAAAFRRCKVHYLKRTLLAVRRRVVVWGAGPTGKRFARALQRDGLQVAAFIDLDPRKLGRTIHGAPVVRPEEIPAYAGSLCVAAVGQDGARRQIRTVLRDAGWREMQDFVAVA